MVGVNTDRDVEAYRAQLEEYGVTWINAWQGGTDGPLPTEWGVRGYPTIYVLDAEGRIRFTNLRGERLGQAVDELLAETRSGSR